MELSLVTHVPSGPINWLCMGWPFCLAEMRREFQTGGKLFCTTLYSPLCSVHFLASRFHLELHGHEKHRKKASHARIPVVVFVASTALCPFSTPLFPLPLLLPLPLRAPSSAAAAATVATVLPLSVLLDGIVRLRWDPPFGDNDGDKVFLSVASREDAPWRRTPFSSPRRLDAAPPPVGEPSLAAAARSTSPVIAASSAASARETPSAPRCDRSASRLMAIERIAPSS